MWTVYKIKKIMIGFNILIVIGVIFIILGIVALLVDSEDFGSALFIILFGGCIIFFTSNFKSTRFDEPIEIPHSEISVFIDNEVAIIRYDDFIETYSNVKTYNAIKCGYFKLVKIVEYNIFDEPNGRRIKLILLDND